MLINIAGKAEGMRLLNIGEALVWIPEAATLQTDGKHLHSTAKSLGIKIAVTKTLLVSQDKIPETVFRVERVA